MQRGTYLDMELLNNSNQLPQFDEFGNAFVDFFVDFPSPPMSVFGSLEATTPDEAMFSDSTGSVWTVSSGTSLLNLDNEKHMNNGSVPSGSYANSISLTPHTTAFAANSLVSLDPSLEPPVENGLQKLKQSAKTPAQKKKTYKSKRSPDQKYLWQMGAAKEATPSMQQIEKAAYSKKYRETKKSRRAELVARKRQLQQELEEKNKIVRALELELSHQ